MRFKTFEFEGESWDAYLTVSGAVEAGGAELLFVSGQSAVRPVYAFAADAQLLDRLERDSDEVIDSVLRRCLERAVTERRIADSSGVRSQSNSLRESGHGETDIRRNDGHG